MILRRKFEEKLNLWLQSNKVLLVTGARQVGKSFLIEKFCREHFKQTIVIDFSKNKEAIAMFAKAKNAEEFLFAVTAFSSVPLEQGSTVIFLDEIQLADAIDLMTMAKALQQDGKYRFIFSGSLLGVIEKNILLAPGGSLYSEAMYPLDFEEFLWANGIQKEIIDLLHHCFQSKTEVPETIHHRMMDYFYLYLLVGGMPDAVKTYLEKKDLPSLNIAFRSIDELYRLDVTKYAPIGERIYIRKAYDLLPSEINSKSKRFVLSTLHERSGLSRSENDFLWLSQAGIALPVYNVDEPKIPLLLAKNSQLLKLFASDVGLLSYRLMDTDTQRKILAHEKNINYGAIFENAVAQELTAHGFQELYYFASKKQGEVDFVISYKGDVLPIEVKSGKDYHRHVALDRLLSDEEYEIPQAFVFSGSNVKVVGKKVYYPVYMIDFVRRFNDDAA